MSSLGLPPLVTGLVMAELGLVDGKPVGVDRRMIVSYHVRGGQLWNFLPRYVRAL